MPAEAAPSHLYTPDLPPAGAFDLSADESRYLTRVCRVRIDGRAAVTDGRGAVAEVRIVGLGGGPGERVRVAIERFERKGPARQAWVLSGPPEGERTDWMVEKLAELGVLVWQPIECQAARWQRADARRARWQRLAIAALRQSRRRHLMEIREPASLQAAIAAVPEGALRWLATPRGGGYRSAPQGSLAVAAVGPASGFVEDEERRLESAGFAPLRLADGRLRAETAAVGWAALWSAG